LILDKTRRNRSSSITAETRIPVGKVRSTEMDPQGEPEGSLSSDPLVGDLSCKPRARIRGSRARHETTARGPPSEPSCATASGPGAIAPGLNPSSSILSGCCLAQSGILRRAVVTQVWRGGGDEETRTPDPLLAKEMLCQLSYVPPPREVVGVSGLEPETSALSGQCSNQLS
jgi:hypothetical protein